MTSGGEKLEIGKWLRGARTRLASLSDTAALDAQVLLAHVLGKPRAWVFAHAEEELSKSLLARLETDLGRLESGEPLPYVLGKWEFFGLGFSVTPDVLIPRPETELLVEGAISWLKCHPDRRSVADVGTGSGCIAISLAVHNRDLRVWAGDISQAALEVAIMNARQHGVEDRITFAQSDLLSGLEGPFDLICANLPYIPTETLRTLPVYGREPDLALDGGPTGISQIGRLIGETRDKLNPGGKLLLEIEARQGEQASQIARVAFPEARIRVVPDLAGHDRLLTVEAV